MPDEELKQALRELATQERKNASLRWTFLRGVVYGFGLFIGSILLVALFLWILSFFDTAPLVGEYIAKIIRAAKK